MIRDGILTVVLALMFFLSGFSIGLSIGTQPIVIECEEIGYD